MERLHSKNPASRATSSREHVHQSILKIKGVVYAFCSSSQFLFLQLFIKIENNSNYTLRIQIVDAVINLHLIHSK